VVGEASLLIFAFVFTLAKILACVFAFAIYDFQIKWIVESKTN
jgi:hypothetical protein